MVQKKPLVTIIIPARNAEKIIGKALNSVLKQDHEKIEILVVDDKSTDKTAQAVRKFKSRKIKLIKNKKNLGPGGSRNVAIKAAKGEYTAFTDADCTVPKDWITNYLKEAKKQKAEILCGPVQTPKELNFFARAVGVLGRPSPTINWSGQVVHFPTCNAFFKTKILKEYKGFAEASKAKRAAETDLLARLWQKGYRFHHSPKSPIMHYHRSNFKQFMRWRFISGIGTFDVASKYIKTFKPSYFFFNFIPLLMLALAIIGLFYKPVYASAIIIAYYLFKFLINYSIKEEFNAAELALGVLLMIISRITKSAGFYYAFFRRII
ncbi:glycosyltransferase [Nanoarchaeota archaeon]